MCSQSVLNTITDEIVNKVKDSLGDKLDRVILYGSYARGDYDDESDIDIMVLADIPREDEWKEYMKISKFISRLGLKYDIFVSVNVTNCATFNKFLRVKPFYKNVLREGVILSA